MKIYNYADIRSQIKCGDLIAFSHGNISGAVIQVFTGSKFTHVAVVAPERFGRVQVFEAVLFGGVREQPLSKLGDFYWVPMNKEISDYALMFAYSRIGDSYSISDCIRGYLGFAKEGNLRWQCAEYAKGIYKRDGRKLSNIATPRKLVDELLKLNGEKIYFVKN